MNKMNNKAAIKQVFTFLMVTILIGLIFLFGIKAMGGLVTDTCEADRVLFIKEIEGYLSKYNVYGSVREEQVSLPCEYTQICFVDKNILGTTHNIETYGSQIINPMIKQSIEANISYNVFLLKENVAEPILYSNKLVINDETINYFCISPTGKKTKITFLGKGKTVAIKLPSTSQDT